MHLSTSPDMIWSLMKQYGHYWGHFIDRSERETTDLEPLDLLLTFGCLFTQKLECLLRIHLSLCLDDLLVVINKWRSQLSRNQSRLRFLFLLLLIWQDWPLRWRIQEQAKLQRHHAHSYARLSSLHIFIIQHDILHFFWVSVAHSKW